MFLLYPFSASYTFEFIFYFVTLFYGISGSCVVSLYGNCGKPEVSTAGCRVVWEDECVLIIIISNAVKNEITEGTTT